MTDLSIRLKLTLVIMALFVAGSVSVIVIIGQTFESNIETLAEQSIQTSQRALDTLEASEIDKLGATLEALRTRDDLRELYLTGDREALFDYAQPLFGDLREQFDITHWYFIRPEPESTVFVRIHNEEKYDDLVERETYIESTDTGEMGAGKELGQTAFALRVVQPYYDTGGDLIGYMELGQEIDEFLGQMKAQTGADYALIVRKDRLDREQWASVREVKGLEDNWDQHPTHLLVDATLEAELLTSYEGDLTDLADEGQVLDRIEEDGRTFVRGIFPVTDASGSRVGGVLVLLDITETVGSIASVRTTLLLVGAVLGALIVGAMLIMLDRLVFRRLSSMTENLQEVSVRVAGGDFSMASTVETGPHDEIGHFEEFFARFLKVVTSALDQLSKPS